MSGAFKDKNVFTTKDEPKKDKLKAEIVEIVEEQSSIINVTSDSIWAADTVESSSFR